MAFRVNLSLMEVPESATTGQTSQHACVRKQDCEAICDGQSEARATGVSSNDSTSVGPTKPTTEDHGVTTGKCTTREYGTDFTMGPQPNSSISDSHPLPTPCLYGHETPPLPPPWGDMQTTPVLPPKSCDLTTPPQPPPWGDLQMTPALPPTPCDLQTPSSAGPYSDVYSIVTSPSAYTVDSRCEFVKGNTNKDEEIRQTLKNAGIDPDEELSDCGIGKCRPRGIQHWANIEFFIFSLCSLSTISGTLVAGYVNSVITTIEKRFEIGSSYSGLIAASVEIGCLVAVIFVSYLGGRRHIPKWIACGTLVQAAGALLFSLPHILAEKYTVTGGLNSNSTNENICKTPYNSHLWYGEQCISKGSGNMGYVFILVLAQVLMGSGFTPLYTLGTTYIDDHVTKEKAPAYIGMYYVYPYIILTYIGMYYVYQYHMLALVAFMSIHISC